MFSRSASREGLIPIDPHNDVRPEAKVDNAAMAFLCRRLVAAGSRHTVRIGDEQADQYRTGSGAYRRAEPGRTVGPGPLSACGVLGNVWPFALNEEVVFDAQPLRINGKPVTAERESATTISAPLVDQDIDKTFVLELRYSIKGTPASAGPARLPGRSGRAAGLPVQLPAGETGACLQRRPVERREDRHWPSVVRSRSRGMSDGELHRLGHRSQPIGSRIQPRLFRSGSLNSLSTPRSVRRTPPTARCG